MDGSAPGLGGGADLEAAAPISPPPVDALMPSWSPLSFNAPTSRSQSPFRSPQQAPTPSATDATVPTTCDANGAAQMQQASDGPRTPETTTETSPQTSTGDDASSTSEKGHRNGQQQEKSDGSGDPELKSSAREAASSAGKKHEKEWFELMPVVLQNLMTRDREQMKRLELPRCAMCERRQTNQKADVKCDEKSCLLFRRPLCSSCWTRTHSSEEAQTHSQMNASNCPHCRLTRIEFWCSECDLSFCSGCFYQIHSLPNVKAHRKLAVEDSPGTNLAKSSWSQNFQNAIKGMIAVEKKKVAGASSTSPKRQDSCASVGEKRKRDVEVITIDDSDSEEGETGKTVVQSTSTFNDGVSRQSDSDMSMSSRPNEIVAGGQYGIPQVQAIVRTNSSSMEFQPPIAHLPVSTIPEPVPFPLQLEEPIVSSFPSSSTSFGSSVPSVQQPSTYSAPTPINVSNGVGTSQWNYSAPQSSMNTVTSSSGMAYTTTGMNNTTMGMQPTSMGVSSEMYGTSSAIITDLAITSNSFIPIGATVFAENPLVDSLLDRYNEVNHNVLQMELQTEQLNKQIAVATYQGLYAASPFMNQLNELQPALAAAKVHRDKLLIAMIIQSNDIMNAVRYLRVNELANVPQVPIVSHRKILQISITINRQKKALMDLNRRMAVTLNEPQTGNSRILTAAIQNISNSITLHENSIQRLKKVREAEIVRIVQFSPTVRDALKHEFQQNLDMQRQHQQQ